MIDAWFQFGNGNFEAKVNNITVQLDIPGGECCKHGSNSSTYYIVLIILYTSYVVIDIMEYFEMNTHGPWEQTKFH